MGLTSSLYTGLSGLTANSQMISVSGNNIANVNTAGFKSGRIAFETQISQNLSPGSAPSGELGGTNPTQIGLGVRVGSVSKNFTNGTLQPTGVNTDLAIEGNGMFMLDFGGVTRFTRAGTFNLDRDYNLVNPDGGLVQGYSVDGDFNVVEGALGPLNIPLGSLTLAEATKTVRFGGNLNSGGDPATQGSVITSGVITDAVTGTGGLADGATSDLVNLQVGGTSIFANGDIITISGATKGGATLPDHTFQVGAVNTTGSDANGTGLDDFLSFAEEVLGIDTTLGDGAGVTIDAAGQLVVTGNRGAVNDMTLTSADIVVNKGTANPTQPFAFVKSQSSDGESVRTTFVSYDSLGNALNVDLSIVLETKSNAGTTWRFYVQSEDDSGLSRVLSNGTISFNTDGQLANVTNDSFSLSRNGTGAETPQSITLEFAGGEQSLSALADESNQLSSLFQDGSPIGTLQDFAVTEDGKIVGQFSNTLIRTLGQVVLATFTNNQGLVDLGGNLYSASVNSGTPQVYTPGNGGAGRIVGSALELSNVDLSQEFINLISASTGFSASSRVLTTSDQLIQELLSTIR